MTPTINNDVCSGNASVMPSAFQRLRAEQSTTCAPLAATTGTGDDPKPQGWLKKRPKPTPVVK